MNIGKQSDTVAFQASTEHPETGIDSIAAMLNRRGKGTLYFGVDKSGNVLGCPVNASIIREIRATMARCIRPEFDFTIEVRKTFEGLGFIEVGFSGDRAPYAVDGRYLIRFSDEDRTMGPDELQTLFSRSRRGYSDWESGDSGVGLSSLDEETFEKAIQDGINANRLPESRGDTLTTLRKFELLNEEGNAFNNAGNVLFSKDGPILLKLASYATETRETFIRLHHFRGNVYTCLQEAMDFVVSSVDWHVRLDGSLQRKESPEIPVSALREILVNAFAHARYDSPTDFEVAVYRDRVSVYSPGPFPSGLTPEDFASGLESPLPMNPRIVEVLFETGRIESFGYGFENTFRECEKAGVETSYGSTSGGFRFVFQRPLSKRRSLDSLTSTDLAVLSAVKDDPYARSSKIAKSIDKSQKTVSRSISKLKGLGYLEREGDDFTGFWKILDR